MSGACFFQLSAWPPALIAIAAILTSVSCISSPAVRQEMRFDSNISARQSEYRLGIGDEVELLFCMAGAPEGYTIQLGDQLDIIFHSDTELNRRVTVLSDGTISLPPARPVVAVGKTAEQLADAVADAFRTTLREPLIFAVPATQHSEGRAALLALGADARGSVRIAVQPDGCLAIPFADTVFVAGKTVGEACRAAVTACGRAFPWLNASAVLRTALNNNVFVFGEVRQPGSYPLAGLRTLTHALAKAQVSLDAAGLRSVALLSAMPGTHPSKRIIDVQRILRSGNMAHDPVLQQYDVVYVPKKPIARIDLFVDQYINKVIPQIFRFGIGWQYDLNELGQ
jgi:polysaccharide export outer membrane protein